MVIDAGNASVRMLPARSSDWHLNVTGILNTTMGVTAVGVPSEADPANGLFVFDITLAHPFPTKPQLSGFDVKGILMTPGSLEIGTLKFADVGETWLENADGYTRWWNPTEFTTSGMFGYLKGNLANTTSDQLTATVNPYKYYADLLSATDDYGELVPEPLDSDYGRGVFTAGSSNTRRYRIRFPMSPGPQVKYGYAVDASWKAPSPNPPVNVPDDFPIEANQPEAYYLLAYASFNNLWYDSETGHSGGLLWCAAEISDWQGMDGGSIKFEVDPMNIYVPDFAAGPISLDIVGETAQAADYRKELWHEVIPTHAGQVVVAYEFGSAGGPTYDQGVAPAPSDNISAWMVRRINVEDPVCEADTNNDAASSEPIAPKSPKAGTLCFTEDDSDWYRLYVPAGYEASGTITFYHDSGVQNLVMYDDDLNDIATGDPHDGYSVIEWDSEHLYAGEYYIEVQVILDTGALKYTLLCNLDYQDITPTPTDVTSPDLDCDAMWLDSSDSGHVVLTGAGGTWDYYVNDPSPYCIGRSHDTIFNRPAYYSGSMYYWEDMSDIPAGIDYVDYSAPSNPIHYEDVIVIPNQVRSLAMDSEYLYVAVSEGGATKIRIYLWSTSPTAPVLFNSFDAEPVNLKIAKMEPGGLWPNTLVAMSQYTLEVFDVGNPFDVTLLDSLSMGSGTNLDLSVDGAWIGRTRLTASDDYVFEVFEWTNLTGITGWGGITLPDSGGFEVKIDNMHAYTDSGLKLAVIDFTTQWGATITKSLSTVCGVGCMDIHSDKLYMINPGAGFSVYSISDPDNPVFQARTLVLNNPLDGDIIGGYGVFIETAYSYSALKSVQYIGTQYADVAYEYLLGAHANCMARYNDVLAVGSNSPPKLFLFDVSDPGAPSLQYSASFSTGVTAVAVSDLAVYAALNNGTIKVYEIMSFPTVNAKPDATFYISHQAKKMLIYGNYMYAIDQTNGSLALGDLTSPFAPTFTTEWSMTSTLMDIEMQTYQFKRYLYLCKLDELAITDLHDAPSLTIVSEIAFPYQMSRMSVDGQLAFVCDLVHTPIAITLFPASSPAILPDPVGEYPGVYNMNLLARNGVLYDMYNSIGLLVYDLY
jgi:hypothetical protein